MNRARSAIRDRSSLRRAAAVLLVALLGVVVWAPAVGASPWGSDRDDPLEKLEDLAETIEDSADRVLDEADRDGHHRRGHRDRESRSLLEDLEDCADELEDLVDDGRSPGATADALRELTLLHRDAERLYHRSRNHDVREELYRMGRLLDRFERHLISFGYQRAPRHRGDYDEDWRHRRRGPGATVVLPRIRIDIPF